MPITSLIDLKDAICSLLDDYGHHLFAEISSLSKSLEAAKLALTTQTELSLTKDEEISSLKIRLQQLEAAKLALTAEVERLKNLTTRVDPSQPPITVDSPPSVGVDAPPSATVSFNSKTLSFTGPGEPNPHLPSERQWFADYDDEIRVLLDADSKTGQYRFTFQRAWSDLPLDAPVRDLQQLQISLPDGTRYVQPSLRLHHHTRPTFVHGRRSITPLLPSFDSSASLASSDFPFLPNYDTDAIEAAAATFIDYRWKPSLAKDADLLTENYHLAHQSWTGGVPLSNEASMFPPWDIYLLTSAGKSPDNSIARKMVYSTWDSIGNYPIHFYDRSTGRPCLLSSPPASTIPAINLENLPKLTTRSGLPLPVPDLAHNFGLPNLAALVTKERYYLESLESFVLLPSLAKKGTERASGLYWSGQVRSNAWRMRDLYHAYLATGERRFKSLIFYHLYYMQTTFATSGSPGSLPAGICSVVPRKLSNWNVYADSTAYETPTGNHYFLAHVLNEIFQHPDFTSAVRPFLLHLLKVPEGVWQTSPSPFAVPWLRHVHPAGSPTWPVIMSATFASKNLSDLADFPFPITDEMACWYRSAVIAAIETAPATTAPWWAYSALKWLDSTVPVSRRPIAWNIKPRSAKN